MYAPITPIARVSGLNVTSDYIHASLRAKRSNPSHRTKKEMDCFASLAMTAQSTRANMPARQNWFDGWRLFALLSLTLLGLSIWIAGMRAFEVDGVRMVIRFTARTSR